ncbi:amidohydrolase family protein [Myxococcus xanthus]|nr:amidohydrolase family protein [Myxococcus xanthus]
MLTPAQFVSEAARGRSHGAGDSLPGGAGLDVGCGAATGPSAGGAGWAAAGRGDSRRSGGRRGPDCAPGGPGGRHRGAGPRGRARAWASFDDARRGRLAPGMDADFVALSEDPLEGPAFALVKAQVLASVVAGAEVYRAPPLA